LDLAAATTVAGNYLVGGLVKAGLWSAWQAGQSTLLVDALDEARLRVTQSSFEDFLADVANVAGMRSIPIVLLGRSVSSKRRGQSSTISRASIRRFSISNYSSPSVQRYFVQAAIKRLAVAVDSTSGKRIYQHLEGSLSAHSLVYEKAATSLVEHLTAEQAQMGGSSAGTRQSLKQ